jgi:hypothetical protein
MLYVRTPAETIFPLFHSSELTLEELKETTTFVSYK